MTLEQPEEFVARFGAAYAARGSAAIAALCAADAVGLTLTGAWAESRDDLERFWSADFAGPLARTRLVTGKGRMQSVSADTVLLHQRFVLSGIVDAEGRDAGRLGAMLTAVLTLSAGGSGWSARSLMLVPLA